jgi:carbon monoxide dehydrogenase subunit G
MTAHMLVIGLWILGSTFAAAATQGDAAPVISVKEGEGGSYTVSAQFSVAAPAATVRAVLTDYEQIPRFMPGIRTSRVLDRGDGRARIEQEAVSKFMMFSKRVHLVLDIAEESDVVRFRDRCEKSFTSYEGAWTIADRGARTEVQYELTATPAFDVPGFVLRRLLDRDARAMIEGLRSEIATRAMTR